MHRAQVPRKKAKPRIWDTLASDLHTGTSRDPSQRISQAGGAQPSQGAPSNNKDTETYLPDPPHDFESFSTESERAQQTQPPKQSSAWTRYRPDVQRAYICKLVDAEQLQKQLVAAQYQVLQRAVDLLLDSCPECQGTSTSRVPFGSSQVLVVDLCHSIKLTIPARACNDCRHIFSVRPVDVGCFPSTPVHSWDLLQGQGQQEQIWFRVSMMHFLDQLVQTQRRVSYDRIAETILRTHDCTESGHSISYDSLRKKLSDAVREFGCMQSHLGDMQELGVDGWPSGPLACCAACWKPSAEGNSHRPIDFSVRRCCCSTAALSMLDLCSDLCSVIKRMICRQWPARSGVALLEHRLQLQGTTSEARRQQSIRRGRGDSICQEAFHCRFRGHQLS